MQSAVHVSQQIVGFRDEFEALFEKALLYFGLAVREKVIRIGGFGWNVFYDWIQIENIVVVEGFLFEIVLAQQDLNAVM